MTDDLPARRLLCIAWEFPPQTTPTSLRTGKLLAWLAAEGWQIEVVTAAVGAALPGYPDVAIRHVPQPQASWRGRLQRLRLGKIVRLIDLLDDRGAWAGPAIAAALEAVAEQRPDVVAVFMMPYTGGRVGSAVKRQTGLPVVMNFDDSPTCDDMHEAFASRWHYRRVIAFEDEIARASDAVVYVSKRNMERVRDRQPPEHRGKFHLVRFGADPAPSAVLAPSDADSFRVVYIGGMTGWHAFGPFARGPGLWVRRLLKWWDRLGEHRLVTLDHRGSSPVFVGRAAHAVMAADSKLAGRVRVEVYGNRNPQSEADRLIAATGVADVVTVKPPVTHEEAVALAAGADLLLIALPARADGSAGGRISAKTYEYLTTDRPIMAAVAAGENTDFLAGRPGVWTVSPTDVDVMARVIGDLARAKFAGRPARFDRNAERQEVRYDARADEFAEVLRSVIT